MADQNQDHDKDEAPLPTHLERRVLHDVHELLSKPYPGIFFRLKDEADLSRACLVISPPDGQQPLHLRIWFPPKYPLEAPVFSMDSQVDHPNVFGGYICADVLGVKYTPAYTLKSICIQILSFFASDNVEQEDYDEKVNLEKYRDMVVNEDGEIEDNFSCKDCGFPNHRAAAAIAGASSTSPLISTQVNASKTAPSLGSKVVTINSLADELLMGVCELLEDEQLIIAKQAWKRFDRLVPSIIRNREIQCFVLKRGFTKLDLGIGIRVEGKKTIKSEFDILSSAAFAELGVKKTTHGLEFNWWLPLPIAQKHWERVKSRAIDSLITLQKQIGFSGSLDQVIYQFMNCVVIQLSTDAEKIASPRNVFGHAAPESALIHASDKAIDSYFHLFHLLVCMATEETKDATATTNATAKTTANATQHRKNELVAHANKSIYDFHANGKRTKDQVPDLGFLLISILISDAEVDDVFLQAIIEEAITRNVLWMLEPAKLGGPGKGMSELAYLEPSPVSQYRIKKTFEAGKTSYRLLMFFNTMRKIVRGMRDDYDEEGNKKKEPKTLKELRDRLSERHGAGPIGAAALFAERARKIQEVDSFKEFYKYMGLKAPSDEELTTLLRDCVKKSMAVGYSKEALTQAQARYLRLEKEPNVERVPGVVAEELRGSFSFFPGGNGQGQSSRGGRGGRGGRGRGGNGRGGARAGQRGRGW